MATRHSRRQQQNWHRFLAKGFELSVGQQGVLVYAELEVTQNPPKVDILLLRRDSAAWTPKQLALLPDGIRDCNANHTLIEFKYTESLTVDAMRQAVGYEYFYRMANDLKSEAVKLFVLCAKTPNTERLEPFGYERTPLAGVYESSQELIEHIPLLVLNDLRDLPHNAFVKAFASRPVQKAKALASIREQPNLSEALLTYFDVLGTIWSLPEGAAMDNVLTPERVLELGQEWKRILLQHTPPDQLKELLSTEVKQQLINEGIEQGIEQGVEQGIHQKTYDMVVAMHAKGFDLAVIADVAGLTVAQVQALLAEP